MTSGCGNHELPHAHMCKEIKKLKENRGSKFVSSALGPPYSGVRAGVVACVKLFPRALMKQTQLIDGEREGSGN